MPIDMSINHHKTPIETLKENENIFIDAKGNYFFWDECQLHSYGPYATELEVKWEMFRYSQEFEGVEMPGFAVMKPFFDNQEIT